MIELTEFPGWENGFETEEEALAAFNDYAANAPRKRSRSRTRQVRSEGRIDFVRTSSALVPVLDFEEDHPVDAIWSWF